MNDSAENQTIDLPWVAIQRNPRSGAGLQAKPIRDLIAEFRRLGIRPRLYSKREELDRRSMIQSPENLSKELSLPEEMELYLT